MLRTQVGNIQNLAMKTQRHWLYMIVELGNLSALTVIGWIRIILVLSLLQRGTRYPSVRARKNKGKSRKRAIQPVKCRDKNAPTPKRARKKVIREFLEEEKIIIKEALENKVSVNGFLLSLPVSVVASDGVVHGEQPSFNGDHVSSGLSTCVT